MDLEEEKKLRAAKEVSASLITPNAAVILYKERAELAEAAGHYILASYYRSLLADAIKKLNGGICL